MIYVLDKNNIPLMPTNRCGKIRRLLKENKAKVVKKEPFTIKLLYDTTSYTQPLTLGIDTGSMMIGAAVSTESNKIIYLSQVKVRDDITLRMKRRKEIRQDRRSRLRYREQRYNNRSSSRRKDRYAPSSLSKINSHIREIEYVKSILPITKTIIEVGSFDAGYIQNNDGLDSYAYNNLRFSILARDKYTCQYCKGKHKDKKLDVHHIVFRSDNGSNKPDNLITLCRTCHNDLHSGKITLDNIGICKDKSVYVVQMHYIKNKLLKIYPDAIATYGSRTYTNRINAKLPKEHYYDACVIATNNGNPVSIQSRLYQKRHISNGEYRLYQVGHKELPRGKVCGYNLHDKVEYMGITGFIRGRMSIGCAILEDIYGTKLDFSYLPRGFKTPKFCNMKKINSRSTTLCTSVVI